MLFRASTLFTSLLLVAPAFAEAPSPDKHGFKVKLHSHALHKLRHAGKTIKSGHAHPHARRLRNGQAEPRPHVEKAHRGHPPLLAATTARSSNPSANLTNIENIQWSVDVHFGTPRQKVPLFISMGSPLTTVAGKGITGDSKVRYDPSKSTSARLVVEGRTEPTSGITSVTYKDKVSVAALEIADQTFSVMTSTPKGSSLEETFDSPVPWPGTFGLGRTGGETRSLSFLENLIRSKIIRLAVCGISITDQGGALDFGFLDTNAYKGNIEYVPVDTKYMDNYWTIKTSGWGLNGKVAARTLSRLQFAPENSLSYISKNLGEQIFADIKHRVEPDTQRYLLSCSLKNSDTIGFSIPNGRMFSMPIPDLILFRSRDDRSMCVTALLQDAERPDDDVFVVGAIQMRSLYVILSYQREHDGPAIGLAHSSFKFLGGDPSQSEK